MRNYSAPWTPLGRAWLFLNSKAEQVISDLSAPTPSMKKSLKGRFLNVLARPLIEILPRYVEKQLKAFFRNCLNEQISQESEMVIERDGVTRWWRIIASPVFSMGDEHKRVINTCIEITDKKLLERQLNITRQRFQAVIENAYDGIITIDEKHTIKLMNEAARDIFGVSETDVLGSNLSRFIPLRYRTKHSEYVASFRGSAVDARPMHSRVAVTGLRADGSEVPLEVAIPRSGSALTSK
ncbi:MAG: PAS domain S-box protein [Candidatus Competibacteraceae bacterium]|nr:PAS domain S-box protein [Candidatus Competibacteraceae bacterium]